jgi:hypothetical protein
VRDVLVERKLVDRWQFLDLRTNEPIFKTDRELAELQIQSRFCIQWKTSGAEACPTIRQSFSAC